MSFEHARTCTTCLLVLPLQSFNKKRAGHQPMCRDCQHARHRKWYLENATRRRAAIRARKRTLQVEHRVKIAELKKAACSDCGRHFEPAQMDFDHREAKREKVSKLVRDGVNWSRIQKEIDNCDLVCACCHRLRTHNRRVHGVPHAP